MNATKRYSTSLIASIAYTFSKNLDATAFVNSQDPAPTKMLSRFGPHPPAGAQRRSAAPFGRGRHFMKNAARPVELIIGGWEYNFIGTIQSGVPLAIRAT